MTILAVLVAIGIIAVGAFARSPAPAAARDPQLGRFSDGGKFFQRFEADFGAAHAPPWLDEHMAYIVAEIETDFGSSMALRESNSYFNRHVGSGAGEWSGTIYNTARGEAIRRYASRPQSVRDFAQLISESAVYKDAFAAMLRKDAAGFYRALVRGNGKEGYVGPSSAPKAAGYLDGLLQRHRARFGEVA